MSLGYDPSPRARVSSSRSLRTTESGAGRAGSGQSGSQRPENPPAEAAGQASPYLYPSENPPSTAPSSPRCWPTHAHRLAHPTVPHPLAPRPPNRHRLPTRSVATPRSHLDCRNVLILIVAGHERPSAGAPDRISAAPASENVPASTGSCHHRPGRDAARRLPDAVAP